MSPAAPAEQQSDLFTSGGTPAFREHWLREIEKAKNARARWMEEAKRALATFRNERDTSPNVSMDQSSSEDDQLQAASVEGRKPINIFGANCLTQEALILSQPPIPQVKKRIGVGDHNQREAAAILQKCLVYSLDAQRPSIMRVLKRIRRDFVVVAMGMGEVEYHEFGIPAAGADRPLPVTVSDDGEWHTPDGMKVPEELVEIDGERPEIGLYTPDQSHQVIEIADESVTLSYLNPMDVLIEPAATVEDARWWAVMERPTRADVTERFGLAVADTLRYEGMGEALDDERDGMVVLDRDGEPNPFARARIWRVFDCERRLVIWIEDDPNLSIGSEETVGIEGENEKRDEVLAIARDNRKLSDFLPFPTPVSLGWTNDEVWGQPELEQIDLINQMLQRLSFRWFHLIDAIRQKMFVSSALETLSPFTDSKPGIEVVPVTDANDPNLDINRHIAWMPLGEIINAAQALEHLINALLQFSHQVSGIPDTWRGMAKPRVTASAEQTKSSIGGGRIEEKRRDFAEFCREALRLMAEVTCTKFQWETIKRMADVDLPRLAQVREQIEEIEGQLQQLQEGAPPEGDEEAAAKAQGEMAEMQSRLHSLQNQPTEDEVNQVLRSRMMRDYAIDVETDSTVAGEADAVRQSRAELLETLVRAADSLGKVIGMGALPPDSITDLFISLLRGIPFTREFVRKLEQWSPPPPPDPPPDPAEIKADADKAIAQFEAQAKAEEGERTRAFQATIEEIKAELQVELERVRQTGKVASEAGRQAGELAKVREQVESREREAAGSRATQMVEGAEGRASKEREASANRESAERQVQVRQNPAGGARKKATQKGKKR